MLVKEGTHINLSLSMNLYLMEGQACQRSQLLHQQICKEFYGYHSVNSCSIPQSHPMYLKIILQMSPKLLYTVMLLHYGDDLACSGLPPENHNTLNPGLISIKQQDHLTKGWAFSFCPGYCYSFTSPNIIVQLYLIFMQRKLLLITVYCENIIALSINGTDIRQPPKQQACVEAVLWVA